MASLSRSLYDMPNTILSGLLFVLMFYSEGNATFQPASQTGLHQVSLEIVVEEVLWSIRGFDLVI